MKKRILSLFLAFVMVVGLLPVGALATGTEDDTVYISVSYDGQYVNDKTGKPMAYIPVSLSELQAIDLEEYGLTEYDYNGQLTALHLYIYTHERIMGKDWSNVGVSGGAGSIFFENGLFGFQDCNLQYYCNGKYPAVDGRGVTADQLVLEAGDFFDIAAYTSWSFYNDSAFGFHYFLDNGEITHAYTATAGEALSVTLGRGASFMGGEYSMTKVSGYTVSYGTAFGTATGTVTTNTDGQAEITFAKAGTYYLWVDGGYGAENPLDIVSAPGCAKVTVTEPACTHETWNAATCKAPKTCAACGATEGEADPDAHKYVDGECEYCGAAEHVATPSYTIKLSEAEELTAGLNYFISVPAEALGKDIIFDFGSGTISGMMCQRHCSQRNIHTAGEGSTLILSAETVEAHLCNETKRAEVAEDFDLYLTEGSQMFAFYWWTTANMNGSYIYVEILPAEGAGGGDEEATYTVTLPINNVGFSVRATSSPTVTSGGEFSFNLNIYDDYKKGENFKVLANGVELTSSDDTYTITNITENQTVTVEGVVEKTLAEKNVTVNAPAGSVVSSGAFHSYFKYDFVEPLQISTLEDDRVQYIVPVTSGAGGFIRVQNPNGVTYWDFGDLAIGKVFNITEEMLFIGNTEYTKDTVYANYEKNGHDTASLYLTANAQGWLDMDTGDTHSLNVFRNWIPVSNSTSNTGVSLPDVTYTVVDVNGNASDVVTVTPDANNSCYADIKAVKAGTAIVLVSYDAVYNADGEGGKQFSAIWPENTGVIVVTVDAEDADIQTNITINEEVNAGGKQILDVEHDILFYVGNAGAEYSFKPENGCTVTISRSTVGNEMTFNGFTNEGVTVAADGTVTLSGLTTGAHIVKVEKDGKAAYQVIRAREVSYKLTHSDGTEVTAENPAQPGETITVQFSKLIDPMGKLSGVYNAKYGFRYVDEVGTVISIKSTSPYGEYYFGSNAARQCFSITVPTEWDKESYTLTDGGIALDGWGSTFGAHRSTTYMEGKDVNTNASGIAGVASVLPDVVIPVYVEKQSPTWQEVMDKTQAYLTDQAEETAPIVGTNKGEWMVLGLARNGVSPDADIFGGYYDNVVNFVKEKIDAETGRLDKNQATVNARVILGLTSIGKDVTDVAGHNLLQGLSDTDFVQKQGINGPVWTLIALDSHYYEIPTNADPSKQVTREWLIDYILDNQLEGGGWKIQGQTADDMTPMAVQALAPYYNSNADVKAAIDQALTIMEGMAETGSPETLAQIIVARSAMGLDSLDVVNKMLAFALEDGSFKKGSSATAANQMSTEQAFYALVAYDRYTSGKTALYDMSNVEIVPNAPVTPDNPGSPSKPDEPSGTPDFGLDEDEIDGYVTVSFEDFGKRVSGETMDAIYQKALGTIIPATKVPYAEGDTVAAVTLRLLETMDFTESHEGSAAEGFYLEAIGGFTHKGTYYKSFGEFDAGVGSGWMITRNGWFIDKGASDFTVKNGDVIRWQYTCQLGADIGDDGSAVGGGNQAPQVPPEVLPEEPPVTSSPYTDVTGHWAAEAITFVYEKGLMTGTKADRFSPETELSRAMLVTILYRMAGEPVVTSDNTFSDVTDGTWYTNAVIWASQNGIVNGVGQDRFSPNQDITREQMAAMLLRYSDYKGYDTTQKNDLADYTDADSISAWALAALQWANGEGLITGRKADLLVPQGDTTRAETATILMRYLETIA